jgi:hypothetical protein
VTDENTLAVGAPLALPNRYRALGNRAKYVERQAEAPILEIARVLVEALQILFALHDFHHFLSNW